MNLSAGAERWADPGTALLPLTPRTAQPASTLSPGPSPSRRCPPRRKRLLPAAAVRRGGRGPQALSESGPRLFRVVHRGCGQASAATPRPRNCQCQLARPKTAAAPAHRRRGSGNARAVGDFLCAAAGAPRARPAGREPGEGGWDPSFTGGRRWRPNDVRPRIRRPADGPDFSTGPGLSGGVSHSCPSVKERLAAAENTAYPIEGENAEG